MESRAAWIACVGLLLGAASASAQQPGPRGPVGVSPSHYTPIAAEQQPQSLPVPPIGARPLAGEARDVRSPAPYRLTSAEAPLVETPQPAPLRLAPRGDHARGAAGKPAPAAATVSGTLSTVVGSLALVLGLFFALVWCTRRFAPSGNSLLPKEAVELLGRAQLAGRQQVQLVRIGSKLLLVAITPTGMETLTEISEPAEVERLLAICRREQPGSSSVAFQQVLTELGREPARGGFVGTAGNASRGGR